MRGQIPLPRPRPSPTPTLSPSKLPQIALYVAGGAAFVRNSGHERVWHWATDHHLLHYAVTIACAIHCHNLLQLTASQPAGP